MNTDGGCAAATTWHFTTQSARRWTNLHGIFWRKPEHAMVKSTLINGLRSSLHYKMELVQVVDVWAGLSKTEQVLCHVWQAKSFHSHAL